MTQITGSLLLFHNLHFFPQPSIPIPFDPLGKALTIAFINPGAGRPEGIM